MRFPLLSITLFALLFMQSGCGTASSTSQEKLPVLLLPHAKVRFEKGLAYVDGEPLTGWTFERYANGRVKTLHPYQQGKKHGPELSFFPNGSKKSHRPYADGKRTGRHLAWFPDGTLRFDYTFEEGLAEGTHFEWYASGQLYRHCHYENGRESGKQQMWKSDGRVKANYVVRNHRRYGLTGVMNCETVQEG